MLNPELMYVKYFQNKQTAQYWFIQIHICKLRCHNGPYAMQPGFLLSAQEKKKQREITQRERQERNKVCTVLLNYCASCHPRSREYRHRVQLFKPSHRAVLSSGLPPLPGLLIDKSALAERIRTTRGIRLQGLQGLLLLRRLRRHGLSGKGVRPRALSLDRLLLDGLLRRRLLALLEGRYLWNRRCTWRYSRESLGKRIGVLST